MTESEVNAWKSCQNISSTVGMTKVINNKFNLDNIRKVKIVLKRVLYNKKGNLNYQNNIFFSLLNIKKVYLIIC